MKKGKSKANLKSTTRPASQMKVSEPSLLAATPPGFYDSGLALHQRAKTARVSVTVDSSLLALIDEYVARQPNTNRSLEFDRALEMWAHWWQAECDNNCYRNMTELEKREHQSWTAITTEAAKYIWP
jgi:hypothetical protein